MIFDRFQSSLFLYFIVKKEKKEKETYMHRAARGRRQSAKCPRHECSNHCLCLFTAAMFVYFRGIAILNSVQVTLDR